MPNCRQRGGNRRREAERRCTGPLEEETPMNRYGLPASCRSGGSCAPGVEAALREQNRLLAELVCAVNGLAGAVLAAGRQG